MRPRPGTGGRALPPHQCPRPACHTGGSNGEVRTTPIPLAPMSRRARDWRMEEQGGWVGAVAEYEASVISACLTTCAYRTSPPITFDGWVRLMPPCQCPPRVGDHLPGSPLPCNLYCYCYSPVTPCYCYCWLLQLPCSVQPPPLLQLLQCIHPAAFALYPAGPERVWQCGRLLLHLGATATALQGLAVQCDGLRLGDGVGPTLPWLWPSVAAPCLLCQGRTRCVCVWGGGGGS